MKPPSVDVSLIKRAQTAEEGDDRPFNELYNLLQPYLAEVARWKWHVEEDVADELINDALFQVYRQIKTFKFQSSFTTWVYVIATNTFLMMLRREKRKPQVLSLDCPIKTAEGGVTLGDTIDRVDHRLEQADARIDLIRAINKLPKGYKRMLILHEIHGLEHSEVAQHTGTSAGNSKSQLSKAKVRLADHLPGYVTTKGQASGASLSG